MSKKKQKTKKGTSKNNIKKVAGKSSFSFAGFIPLLIALGVTLVVFIPSLSNQFVNWDDDVNVIENPNLEVFNWQSVQNIFNPVEGHVIGNYNPLTILTFAIEKHFVDLNPFLYHFDNLLLHLFCVFFVYRLMLLFKLSPQAAMVVALLFGIHPMRVESVAWVTERKDVLFGVFFLWALYLYTRYVSEGLKNKKLVWFAMGLFILSLLSKIQAVALPLTMLAVDYYFKRPLKFNLIIEKIPFFLLSLFFGILGIYTLGIEGSLNDNVTEYSFFDRLLVGGYSWVVYLMKAVVPYKMVPMYPYPKTLGWLFYVYPIIAIATLGGAYWAFIKEKRGLFFGFLIFFFNVVFMLQILGAGQGFIADRFTYIPYLGLFFIVGYYFDKIIIEKPQIKKYLSAALGAYLVFCAFLSFQQIKIWENGATLWTHAIENLETTSLPHGNRAHYYRDLKQYDLSLKDYTEAIRISPKKAELYNSRGKTYFDSGNAMAALKDYQQAIALDDSEAEFHVNQGAALGSQGALQEAIQSLTAGIAADPEFSNAYLNRSLAYNQLGQMEAALQDITKFLEFKPYNSEMWYEKGITLRTLGRSQEAIPAFNQAIQLEERGIYYYERGRTYAALNQIPQAKQDVLTAQAMGVEVREDMQPLLQ